ncbi:iron-containing alcohol dehydrogenase [Weizmannia coagulans]|jgi:alcohol dehydrogenase YqhD (iron-dependent ADH family)|uniref:NADH-dependent butanol dehydrogenase A n=2 Tax=Heyndrickxia TaxID=2837504 RepID=A0A0C5CCI5_HEYCO|nr:MULTISPECIES: iron-containing alcohol dehydrogenase [Heyndrickxia]AJO24526.1 NADH-dependent butanol dehydrogenase A [Heyndrickxia coagulans]AKN54017.1 NADH-dependent butanol dehydrogenase A [Heyndrickxia coagulans]ATW84325.1 NADH-dependent alcohol dehydrogenase [Heyndrickxia coagulans]AVD55013.1 NADH-dependent alcohol dehydrogenase [Heyndrickxia coagulans]AWP35890.1 NADH-dependent alcohol dehydrogenase [Heyndrickxia coagulans]
MNPFTFYNPTELIFGKGQLEKLDEKIDQLGKRILLVYGGGSIKRSGLYDKLQAIFEKKGCHVRELAGVEPNPRLSTVKKGISLIRENELDWILAVGGGSVIDCSKAIAGGALYDGDVWDFYERKAKVEKALPLGTVLTLAATGSEMNKGSVITNWETQQKHGASMTFPTFSILDPENTFTVPRNQTVYGISDTLSHVFEQYFSHTKEIPLQTGFAETIMKTVIENARKVLQNLEDYDARANLMLSSTFALNGLLATGVETDWATHSIEHAVSAVYDIPHGGGLAIIFPNWMKYVYKENIPRFKRFAVEVWGVDPAGKTDEEIALAGIDAVRAFFNEIGAPSRLADYNIGDDKLDVMAEKALPFGPIGNFKKLGKEDVREILKMSL